MELEQRVSATEQKLMELEPDIKENTRWRITSKILLYGKEDDKDDEGIIGVQNDIKRSLLKIERVVTAVAIPLIIGAITWVVTLLLSL